MRGLGQQTPEESGLIFTAGGDMSWAEEPATLDELDPSEIQALLELQEWSHALIAYGHLTTELGMPADSPPAEVGAKLHALDMTIDEVAHWLPACDYDLDCFRQTMFVELRAARRRVADQRTKRITVGATVAVLGLAAWMRWKR